MLYKDVAKKLATWRKRWGVDDGRRHEEGGRHAERAEHPTAPFHLQPHWQQALDRKVEAIESWARGRRSSIDVATDNGLELLDTPMARLMVGYG